MKNHVTRLERLERITQPTTIKYRVFIRDSKDLYHEFQENGPDIVLTAKEYNALPGRHISPQFENGEDWG